jgi:transposase
MDNSKVKKFTYFIGIDVSKSKLDIAIRNEKTLLFLKEIGNNIKDIELAIKGLKMLPKFTVTKSIFCMENTGIYCNHLKTYLKKIKANLAIEHPLHIKQSFGLVRGKNDKIDAIRIANFAFKNKQDITSVIPKRPVIQKLANLCSLRSRLLDIQTALKMPLKEQKEFVDKGLVKLNNTLCEDSITALKTDLTNVEQTIDILISSDNHLNELMKIVTSVPQIGPVTAMYIVICTNEFRSISTAKKFASYAGVAPFQDESGTIKRKARVSNIANKKMKALLHICSLGAIRNVEELKNYYTRKTTIEGKSKMLVINAIRNKLILRIFSCVNQNRLYSKVYEPAITS